MYKRDRKTSFKKIGARSLNMNHSTNNSSKASTRRLKMYEEQLQAKQARAPQKTQEEQFIHSYINDMENRIPYTGPDQASPDESFEEDGLPLSRGQQTLIK